MNRENPLEQAATKGFRLCLIVAGVLLALSAVPILGYLGGLFSNRRVMAVGLLLLVAGTVLLVTGFFGFLGALGLGRKSPPEDAAAKGSSEDEKKLP